MTGVALQRAGECNFHDLVRALLMLLLSEVFLQVLFQISIRVDSHSLPYNEPIQAEEDDFDAALSLFERLIDDLRFGENAPTDGSAAQRKDDDFIINLDRECNAIQIPYR